MRSTPRALSALAVATLLPLAACSSDGDTAASTTTAPSTSSSPATSSAMPSMPEGGGHEGHAMDGGPAPAGIKAAANPRYAKGTKVTIQADHMPGMKGATGTVAGTYQTFTYAVSYTPTTGGPKVTNHKWVVQEELKGAGTERVADGKTVTLDADHMPGMKGATATVDSSTDQVVYMVDYEHGGMQMTNHKWVTEDELLPAS